MPQESQHDPGLSGETSADFEEVPHGTQPEVGDIMFHSVLPYVTHVKEVIPQPTSHHPHKVKVRILRDDTWITLWFGYTPWKLATRANQPTGHTPIPWKVAENLHGEGIWIEGGSDDEPDEICQVSSATVSEAEASSNARFIVRACNSHRQLLESLLLARDDLQLVSDGNDGSHGKTLDKILNAIEKATTS